MWCALVAMLLLSIGLGAAWGTGSVSGSAASTVVAWGANGSGQLGDNSTSPSDVPVQVHLPTGTAVTAVAAGQNHSLALVSGGASMLAWGDNTDGQLGDGNNNPSLVPVDVSLPSATTVTSIGAGRLHSLAVTSTGSVLAWGANNFGQLGDNGTSPSNVPVDAMIPTGTKVKAVAGGWGHSLALTSSGAVLAWGYNFDGELGDGNHTNSHVPVKVKLPTGTKVTAIAAGAFHSLALTSTGSVLAWGDNQDGELGRSGPSSDLPVKVKLPSGLTATAIAAGAYHSLAVTSTGSALAWGHNLYGELGDNSHTASAVPVKVKLPHLTKVTRVTAGQYHSLALTSTGSLLAWGYGLDGELGDGSMSSSAVPVPVTLSSGQTATAVRSGSYALDSLALVK